MTTERYYTLDDLDQTEYEAILLHREARRNPPPPLPQARRPRRSSSVILTMVLVCLALVVVGYGALNIVFALGLYTPPGWAAYAAPTAEALPTAAVSVRTAPVSVPQPFSAPVAAPPASVYPDTVAPYQAGAWTPGGPFELDVAGRQYRALGMQGGVVYAELDDGTHVWLGTPVVETAPVATPIAQPAPFVAVPQPTTQPASMPALPALDAPTPTWGPGGSTGGSTW